MNAAPSAGRSSHPTSTRVHDRQSNSSVASPQSVPWSHANASGTHSRENRHWNSASPHTGAATTAAPAAGPPKWNVAATSHAQSPLPATASGTHRFTYRNSPRVAFAWPSGTSARPATHRLCDAHRPSSPTSPMKKYGPPQYPNKRTLGTLGAARSRGPAPSSPSSPYRVIADSSAAVSSEYSTRCAGFTKSLWLTWIVSVAAPAGTGTRHKRVCVDALTSPPTNRRCRTHASVAFGASPAWPRGSRATPAAALPASSGDQYAVYSCRDVPSVTRVAVKLDATSSPTADVSWLRSAARASASLAVRVASGSATAMNTGSFSAVRVAFVPSGSAYRYSTAYDGMLTLERVLEAKPIAAASAKAMPSTTSQPSNSSKSDKKFAARPPTTIG